MDTIAISRGEIEIDRKRKPFVTKETLPGFFEDLHNLLWNKAGLSPERALEHMIFFFAYRLIEPQANTLQLPKECRWSYIAELRNENDLFETIKQGVKEFRKNSMTKPFFRPHEIQKADIVREIVQHIHRISFDILQETDTLGDIYEYMIGRGMSTMSDEGQYFTKRTICTLAFDLSYRIKQHLRRPDGSLCTFADWFCGTGGFPAAYIKGVEANLSEVDWKKDSASIYCQDMSSGSITTTLLNMLILTGMPFSSEKIRSADSFHDAITMGVHAAFPERTMDYLFLNPPYGGDKNKGKEYKFTYAKTIKGEDGSRRKKFFVNPEIQSIGIEDNDKVSAGLQLAMATLSPDGGVCCIVLSQGFFGGISKKYVALRQKLAEEYKIWYVVDIASGSFTNTVTKTSMLVFQKGVGPTDTVSFLSIDQTVRAEATLDDLRTHHYSFHYKQYLTPCPSQHVGGNVDFERIPLGDLVEFSGGKFTTKYAQQNPGGYPFYSGKAQQPDGSCKDCCFDGEEYLLLIKDGGSGEGKYGDHIGLGKVFYVQGQAAANSHVTALHRKSDEVLIQYLYYYLSTVKNSIMDLANYTTGLGHIRRESLCSIEIPVPSLVRQQEIICCHGWSFLVEQEQAMLERLETQILWEMKERARRQIPVRVGDVCEFRAGKSLTKSNLVEGVVPVVGGGVAPMGFHNVHNRDAYEVLLAKIGSAGHLSRYPLPTWVTNNGVTVHRRPDSGMINDDVLYYTLLNIRDQVKQCGEGNGTAQPYLDMMSVQLLEIVIPCLQDQEELQPEMDEIRHKHAKILRYQHKIKETSGIIPRLV